MKILFIGCVQSSYTLLRKLINIHANVAGVITKKESSFNSDFRDLFPLCQKYHIECIYVQNINDYESMNFIQKVNADIGFCFGWSQLIKEKIINLLPKGIIGFHPALLPYNRGRHPIIWALFLGLPETASTFFQIDTTADTGDILLQEKIEITYEDDAGTLYKKIMETACNQIELLVKGLEQNSLVHVQQHPQGNTWRKRGINDGRIDFRMSGRSIYNLVRSLTKPYPGAHIVKAQKQYRVWKVCEIEMTGLEHIEPGKILEIYNDGTFDVKAADKIIRVLECDKISLKKGEYLYP